MSYDDNKELGETIFSADWDAMVAILKTGAVPIFTFADGDATPSVAGASAGLIPGATTFKTANTTSTVITTFDDGIEGQLVTVMAGDDLTSITPGATLLCNAAAPIVLLQYDTVSFRLIDAIWVCVGHNLNT